MFEVTLENYKTFHWLEVWVKEPSVVVDADEGDIFSERTSSKSFEPLFGTDRRNVNVIVISVDLALIRVKIKKDDDENLRSPWPCLTSFWNRDDIQFREDEKKNGSMLCLNQNESCLLKMTGLTWCPTSVRLVQIDLQERGLGLECYRGPFMNGRVRWTQEEVQA